MLRVEELIIVLDYVSGVYAFGLDDNEEWIIPFSVFRFLFSAFCFPNVDAAVPHYLRGSDSEWSHNL